MNYSYKIPVLDMGTGCFDWNEDRSYGLATVNLFDGRFHLEAILVTEEEDRLLAVCEDYQNKLDQMTVTFSDDRFSTVDLPGLGRRQRYVIWMTPFDR